MIKFSHALVAAAALAIGTSASASTTTNLVTNGDFSNQFTGWTLSGNTGYISINNDSGSFGAIGSPTYLEQSLAVSATGEYVVSFDLRDGAPGASGESFTASLGGATLLSATTGSSAFTHYSFEVQGGSGVLEFAFRNDPSYWYIDNVSVAAAVPEAGSSTMLLAGIALLGFAALRRRGAR